ncbi:MAG: hypothetical protein OSB42_05405 [Planctomycetota bacterium]|nr:hypothetical protein [Planctomycetota bacterium]
MSRFLKDNWIWILAPVVLVIIVMIVITILNPGNTPAGFEYEL